MADPSDYHGIPRPDEGKDPWTQDYYDLVAQVDSNVPIRGALADRPASPPDGSVFVVDDDADDEHGAAYRYDAGDGSWGRADRRLGELSARLTNGVLNAAFYADLQSAVDATPSGWELRLEPGGGSGPNGEYMVTAGSNGTAVKLGGIKVSGPRAAVVKLEDNTDSGYRAMLEPGDDTTLEGFTLDGNRANQADGGSRNFQHGIYENGSEETTIRDMEIRNCQYKGVSLRNCSGLTLEDNYIHDCGARAAQANAPSGNETRDVTFEGNRALNCGGASDAVGGGLVIGDRVAHSSVVGNHVEGAVGSAIRVEDCHHITVTGNTVKAPTGAGLHSTGNHFITWQGNTVEDPGGDGIILSGGSHHKTDNEISGAGRHGVNALAGEQLTVRDTIDSPARHGIVLSGSDVGANIDGAWVEDANRDAGGYSSVYLTTDAGGDNCLNVRITGTFKAKPGTANPPAYGVEAVDGNQTALVDGSVIKGHASGETSGAGITTGVTL